MKNTSTIFLKITGLILVLVAIWGALSWWGNYKVKRQAYEDSVRPMVSQVLYTPHQNNTLVAPAGLPKDLPLNKSGITSSYTTKFERGEAVQSSVVFETKTSAEAEYKIYLDYLNQNGYAVSEGKDDAGTLSLSGRKSNANLLVTINTASSTIVSITHLAF